VNAQSALANCINKRKINHTSKSKERKHQIKSKLEKFEMFLNVKPKSNKPSTSWMYATLEQEFPQR
jgi:hypothetical protein